MPVLADVFKSFYRSWVFPGYNQQAIWLPRITQDTLGAFNTAGWDSDREQETDRTSDGSYGIGWAYVDEDNITRKGYQKPIPIKNIGVTEDAKVAIWADDGVVTYQGPLIITEPEITLTKWDLIVMISGFDNDGLPIIEPDNRRFVVGDRINPAQVLGTKVVVVSTLEKRSLADIVYTVPLV